MNAFAERNVCKNDYPGNLICESFEKVLNNIYLFKENVRALGKNRLLLVLSYFGIMYFQIRTTTNIK